MLCHTKFHSYPETVEKILYITEMPSRTNFLDYYKYYYKYVFILEICGKWLA
jgi:hypothetical protein